MSQALPPPSTTEPCPRCGFLFTHVPPVCPRCKFMFYAPPLTDKQRLWNKIGLYGVTIPGLVLAALPVAWIGTVIVELALAGPNVEQGPGIAQEQADKSIFPAVMVGIVLAFVWFAYRYALNKPDTKRLMESDLD